MQDRALPPVQDGLRELCPDPETGLHDSLFMPTQFHLSAFGDTVRTEGLASLLRLRNGKHATIIIDAEIAFD